MIVLSSPRIRLSRFGSCVMPLMPARRYDPSQYLGEILLANDPLLAGLRLAVLDKLLADAVLAVINVDLCLADARHLLDLKGILRGPHAHSFE